MEIDRVLEFLLHDFEEGSTCSVQVLTLPQKCAGTDNKEHLASSSDKSLAAAAAAVVLQEQLKARLLLKLYDCPAKGVPISCDR